MLRKFVFGGLATVMTILLFYTLVLPVAADSTIVLNQTNNHCYQLVQSDVGWIDWNQAKAMAEARGGYLATITSQQEQDFILGTFGSWIGWLGGRIDGTYDPTKLPSEQTWIWITGEPWSYENWGSGQPSGWFGDGYEDRLEWSFGAWNDLRFYAVRPNLLVEYDSCNTNTPPTFSDITVPVDPVAVDAQPVNATVLYSDPDSDDTHTCSIDWGDGQTTNGDCTQTHTYAGPGVYALSATVTDAAGASDSGTGTSFLVIYDASAGFATGGGWIDSPAGALPTLREEIWHIGLDDSSVSEFFENGSQPDTDFVCDDNPFAGWYGEQANFVIGTTPDAKFPGEGRSSNASAGDPRYKWACNSVTIEFSSDQHWYDSVLTYARMGGEDSQVFFDGVSIGDTTASNPGVDPHPSRDYFFIPGPITPGTHYITIVGMERPSFADGYHFNDYLLLEGNPSVLGKATFGFVSKYKKGADTPTGNTEFQFQAGDLNFHSSSYDWLVINQGGTNAQFKGEGTINGAGIYKFMIWAGDDAEDTFRIRIWEEDVDGNETDVYDNGTDQAIGGGSIVVHTN